MHEKNISYNLTLIDTEQKPDWFLQIAPLGLVPVMRTSDLVIPDSHPICKYIDKLKTPYLFPAISQQFWLNYADTLANEIARLVKQGNILAANFDELHRLLGIFNQHCQLPFFLGKNFL